MSAGYRPEFVAALQLFARKRSDVCARSSAADPRGRCCGEFWSASAVTTGDFDICTTRQPELEEELQRFGFVRPSGAGSMLQGWIHPELRLGFEVVADLPMDGNVDAAHIRPIEPINETALFRIISVEDLIADRFAQYASGTASDRIEQARLLLDLSPDVGIEYPERRIREESSGDYVVEDLQR